LLLNKALDKLANKVTAGDISETFDNMSQALAGLDRAIGPVVGALVSIVKVGSQVLKELAGPIAEVLDDWGNRIQIMANQGTLKAMFYEGIDALKALGGLVKDVFGIISGVVKAAGSSDGLFGFFTRLHEYIDSVQGQNALISFFQSMKQISDALAPVLPALGDALGLVARGIADIALAFAPYLPGLTKALGEALSALEPAITALAPLLGVIAIGLQPLATILRDLVTAAAPGLEAALGGIVGALTALAPVAAPVGKAIGDIFTAIAPLLPTLASLAAVLLQIAATALTSLATALMPVISVLAGAFTNALQILLPQLAQMANAVLPLFAQAGAQVAQAFIPLAPVIAQLVTEGLAAMMPYIPQIVAGFISLLPVVTQLAGQLGQALLQALLNLVPILPDLVKSGMELVLAFISLMQAIMPLLPQLVPLIQMVLETALNANTLQLILMMLGGYLVIITGIIMTTTAIINGLVWIFKAAWNAAKDLAGAIGGYIADSFRKLKNFGSDALHALGNLSSTLREAGKDLIRGLIHGIEAMWGALKDKLSKLTSMLPSWKGPEAKDRRILEPAGRAIMQGLEYGITARVPNLRRLLGDVTNTIAAAGGGQGGVGVGGAGVGAGGVSMQFAAGSIVLDASKIKSLQDLLDLLAALKSTSRQYGGAVA
jgi:phage-related protein